MTAWREVVQSRLVQFLGIGGCIFAAARGPDDRRIEVDARTLDAVRAEEAKRLGVAKLSEAQAREVETRAVADAVLVREAKRLGLDRDDRLVNQRLAQKVLFLAEDLGGGSREPSEADLRAFFATAGDRYVQPERLRFVHVVVGTEAEALALVGDVRAWDEGKHAENAAPPFGEPLPTSRFVDTRAADVAVVYGEEFVEAMRALPTGEAFGRAVRSRLGWHLVKVLGHEPARPATFEEVRGTLPLDWLVARREAAVARYLADASRRYVIAVDGRPLAALDGVKRTAVRSQASEED